MAGYQTPLDIANRACQHAGVPLIYSFGDQSAPAVNINLAYDKIREFELQRNMWTFATRRAVLRPMSSASAQITFQAYAAGTTYHSGFVVTYGGLIWYSLVDSNVGNTPGTFPTDGTPLKWDLYFGPVIAQVWNEGNTSTTTNTTYGRGEIIYITPGDGTYTIYRSLVEGNSQNPEDPDDWDSTTTYQAGEVVEYLEVNYQSLVAFNLGYTPLTSGAQWADVTNVSAYSGATTYSKGQVVTQTAVYYVSVADANLNNTPPNATYWSVLVPSSTVSASWTRLTSATLVTAPITYPLTAGPVQQLASRNAFRLPNGFLKMCPEDPKDGQVTWLGGPSGLSERDWTLEGHWLVSRTVNPITIRFVANIIDVTKFHPMFSEAFSAAIATDAIKGERPREAAMAYRTAIRDARTMNAIEIGTVTPADDSYITVRL